MLYLPSSGGKYAVPKQRGFGRKIMIVERIFAIEKVGLGSGKMQFYLSKTKTFTDHQLTDVFTEVVERWQKYSSTVCGNPARNSTITVTFRLW